MSGFLQRMASGVLHSKPAIHPSIGTLFAPPRSRDAGIEAIETVSEFLVRPAQRHDDSPASTWAERGMTRENMTRTITGNVAGPPAESPAASPPAAGPAFAGAIDFEPLVALPQRSISAPQFIAHAPSPASAHEESSTSAERPQTPEDRIEINPDLKVNRQHQGQSAHPGESTIQPSTSLIAAPAAPARRDYASFASSAARAAAPAPVQASSRSQDEIEIHIGRIEVLAAPPRPAQPAASKPARKSIDLVEYLRRDRRVR